MSDQYILLDCGDQKKVEQFGKYKIIRPCPQAMWPITDEIFWQNPDIEFVRTNKEKGLWKVLNKEILSELNLAHSNQEVMLPNLPVWTMLAGDLVWSVEPNEFGNMGIFTEHLTYSQSLPSLFGQKAKVLDLFSYTGSNAMHLVKAGLEITAVDSSRSAMNSYVRNMEQNGVDRQGQRLILEDAYKFIARESRRGSKYDGIMVDAPSYGRGTKGEIFNIEDDLVRLLQTTGELLSEAGKMVVTLHSPRFTPAILRILIGKLFPSKTVSAEEILNPCQSGVDLPSGFLVRIV